MSEIEALTQVNYSALFIQIVTVLIGIKAVTSVFEWTIEKLGLETKWMRQKREEHDLLIQTSQALNSLQQKHETDVSEIYNDSLLHYKQSCEIRENLTDSINSIFEKLDHMQKRTDERFSESEEKENKRVQAEIKDKIAQSYRHYSAEKQISSMELEALEDLISTYENYGGANSFIHSVVQKEMYTWEVK